MTPEQYKQRFPDRAAPVSAEYLGQWIAWNESGQKIVAHGETLSDVAAQSRVLGYDKPIMQKIHHSTFVGQRLSMQY